MLGFLFTKTPLLFLVQSFWRDESFSFLMASRPVFEMLRLTATDFNPPLYYLVLKMWMTVLGHSEIVLRSLSLVFAVFTVYISYEFIVGVMHVRSKWRYFYFILILFSPFLTYYAFEARMYSMLACFGTLSWYFLAKKNRRGYILATIAGLYTHYFMVLVLVSQALYIVLTSRDAKRREALRIMGVAVAWFVPWILFVIAQKPPVSSQFWIVPPTSTTVMSSLAIMFTGFEEWVFGPIGASLYLLQLLIVVYILFALLIFQRKDGPIRHRLILSALWTAVPMTLILLISPWKPLFLPRYLIFCCIGLNLFLIETLEHVSKPLRTSLLFFLLLFCIIFQQKQIKAREKQDVRTVIRIIKAQMRPADVLFVDDVLNLPVAQYYFDEKRTFLIGKTYGEIPAYVGKVLIPQDRIVFQPPAFPRRAFILHDDLSYDIQSVH